MNYNIELFIRNKSLIVLKGWVIDTIELNDVIYISSPNTDFINSMNMHYRSDVLQNFNISKKINCGFETYVRIESINESNEVVLFNKKKAIVISLNEYFSELKGFNR